MNTLFRTPEDYELFLYTITELFPSVKRSSLVFVRRGSTLGRIAGELYFANGFRLAMRERVLFRQLPIVTTKSGRMTKSCTGTIPSLTRTAHFWRVRILITNIFLRTSNGTVFRHRT